MAKQTTQLTKAVSETNTAPRQKWQRRSAAEIERDRNIQTVQNLIRSGQQSVADTLAKTFGLSPEEYAIGKRGRPSTGPKVNESTLTPGERATWAKAAKVIADSTRHSAEGPQGLEQRVAKTRARLANLETMERTFDGALAWAETYGRKLAGEKVSDSELEKHAEDFEAFVKAANLAPGS